MNERDEVLRFVLLWAIFGGMGIAAVGLFLGLPVVVVVGLFVSIGAVCWRYLLPREQNE